MTDWYTYATAKAVWPDIPAATGQNLLDLAKEQIVEYVTDQPFKSWTQPEDGVPARWLQAQLLQAQAVWQATQASPQDTMGGDTQSVRLYPMGWQIRALLTPPRSVPGVG